MITVLGFDISLNHGAAVELVDGEYSNHYYATDKVGLAAKSKKHGDHIPISKIKDSIERSLRRYDFWWDWIDNVLDESRPDYVGLEDYAYKAGYQAHQIGEVGGKARWLIWDSGALFRLHEPGAPKLFVAHNGDATKEDMWNATVVRWPSLLMAFGHYVKRDAVSDAILSLTDVAGDLCDAHAIAQLVWTEVQLRKGMIKLLSDLHEKEIQVFNRATKAWPVNVLGREWIRKVD